MSVGSEAQLNTNHLKFGHTADTGFGIYNKHEYTSPMTYRVDSPSPRRNRNSLIASGSMPFDVNVTQ